MFALATTPDPRRSLTKGQRTRQRLLRVAVDRFGTQGFRGTSVSQLSRDAGLAPAAAYAYFADKDAYWTAAIEADLDALEAEIRDAALRSEQPIYDLMAGLHPLAVAAGTCKPRAWRPLFGRIWRDAHHPLPPETADPAGRRILAWHRTAWREELGAFAKRHGIVEKAIAIAPEAPGESVRAYCPRCLSLFAKTGIRCDRCGGMPVSSVAA